MFQGPVVMETESAVQLESGWVQINNTVLPYLTQAPRDAPGSRLVPLAVVRYGACLLRDRSANALRASPLECNVLTDKCTEAKLDFRFVYEECVELISMDELEAKCNVVVNWLPGKNPFAYTKVVPLERIEESMCCDGPRVSDIIVKDKEVETESVGHTSLDEAIDLTKDSEKWDDRDICKSSLQFLPMQCIATHNDVQMEPLDLSLKSSANCRNLQNEHSRSIRGNTPIQIVPAMLMGRKIPCIVKGGIHYVLVETLRRAYFPQCSLRALMFMVNRSISPFVYDLEQNDISAIMSFCKNPTSLSRSTKVISFRDARQLLPMFKAFLRKVQHQRQLRKSESKSADQTHIQNDSHTNSNMSASSTPSESQNLLRNSHSHGQGFISVANDSSESQSVENFKVSNFQRNTSPAKYPQHSAHARPKGRTRNLQEALRRIQQK